MYPAGASAVVAAFCDVLRVPQSIDAAARWDAPPLLGQLLDGNRSDKTWYPEVLDQLVETLISEQLKQTIFVADAALPTTDNLRRIAEKKLLFISRLSEVFSLAEDLKDLAWEKDAWSEVGALSPKPTAASYRTQSFIREIDGITYRFVVVHSSSLEKQKEKSLERRWQKEREEMEEEAKTLLKRPFACIADAEKAISLFLQEHQKSIYHLSGSVENRNYQQIPPSVTDQGRRNAGN